MLELPNAGLFDGAWLPKAPVEPLVVAAPKADGWALGVDALPNAVELPNVDWPNVDVVPPVLPNGADLPNVDCC